MNKYESIIIVNPSVDEAGLKALEEKFTGLINENGKVESTENMGKKTLAYEINKCKEGTYILFNFNFMAYITYFYNRTGTRKNRKI